MFYEGEMLVHTNLELCPVLSWSFPLDCMLQGLRLCCSVLSAPLEAGKHLAHTRSLGNAWNDCMNFCHLRVGAECIFKRQHSLSQPTFSSPSVTLALRRSSLCFRCLEPGKGGDTTGFPRLSHKSQYNVHLVPWEPSRHTVRKPRPATGRAHVPR